MFPLPSPMRGASSKGVSQPFPDRPMAPAQPSLDDLRRDLDEIDNAIHDLIMRRTEVVERVAGAKEHAGGRGVLRPGREARILRRLVARHRGAFPVASLVRVWRELISASVAMQTRFSVAVFRPEPDPGYWVLAREQFGIYAPMTAHATPEAAIRAVAAGDATVAVVPMPEAEDEEKSWWAALVQGQLAGGDDIPQVIWYLPFTGSSSGPLAGLGALVLSMAPQEESGEDRSLFVFETDAAGAFADLVTALKAQGLPPVEVCAREEGEKGLVLVLLDGYIGAEDPRLAGIAGGADRLHALGGYPVPFLVPVPEAKG